MAAKKKVARWQRQPKLAHADLDRAQAYVEILRWAADTLDRHESNLSNMVNQSLAIQYFHKTGDFGPLDEYARKFNVKILEEEPEPVGIGWLAPLSPFYDPYRAVVLFAGDRVTRARAVRDAFAAQLLSCRAKNSDLVSVFGKMYGLKRAVVLDLPAEEIIGTRQLDGTVPPQDDLAIIATRDRWIVWTVGHIRTVLSDPSDGAALDSAATSLFFARVDSQKLRRARTAEGMRGWAIPNPDEDIPQVRATILELADHPTVRAARAGRGDRRKRGGTKNAAICLVALALQDLSVSAVEKIVSAAKPEKVRGAMFK